MLRLPPQREKSVLTALAAVAGCVAVFAGSARAAYLFGDDFSGPSLNVNLVDVEGAYFLSGGKAGSTAPRSYLRTVEDDYVSIDFQADLIYSIAGATGASGIFFGIGAGTEDAGYFEEPESAVYLVDHPNGYVSWPASDIVVRRNGTGAGVVTDLANLPFPDGTAYARITKIGDSLTFAYDFAYDGVSFVPDGSYTLSISATTPFLATKSHLLFGTGLSPSRFDSIQIQAVPEPASAALLAGGLAALALRRRRSAARLRS